MNVEIEKQCNDLANNNLNVTEKFLNERIVGVETEFVNENFLDGHLSCDRKKFIGCSFENCDVFISGDSNSFVGCFFINCKKVIITGDNNLIAYNTFKKCGRIQLSAPLISLHYNQFFDRDYK